METIFIRKFLEAWYTCTTSHQHTYTHLHTHTHTVHRSHRKISLLVSWLFYTPQQHNNYFVVKILVWKLGTCLYFVSKKIQQSAIHRSYFSFWNNNFQVFKYEVLDKQFVILTTGIIGNRESEINTHFESWHIVSLMLHKIQHDKS